MERKHFEEEMLKKIMSLILSEHFGHSFKVLASTILAGRIAHMTESIEDEQKLRELFEDLQEHIHNNYVNAPRENYNS
jgi:translation initiation factor 2 alpha subunit (eIF-2alpha)